MDAKSLEMIDFPKIRELVAGYASFSASRDMALALEPLLNFEVIGLLQKQTAEVRHLLETDKGFAIGAVTDVRGKARLAALEGVLDPASLMEIQQTLAAFHDLRRYLKSIQEECPLVWSIAEGIADLQQVEKDIASCLGPDGEILDSASPELASIRARLRDTRSQILEKLEDIVKSPRNADFLQEDVITEREGRYVILVKTEERHEMKGIVHDISNTGSTVFMEPTATVGLGNAIRELVVEERHEIEKILRLLTAEVGACVEEINRSVELAAELDLILAKARYSRRINAVEPVIIDPKSSNRSYVKLIDARHPLLGEKAVPFSAELGDKFRVMIITGPNTGGKTVTLKTIGLLCVMAQSGLPIPADAQSIVPVLDGVFADIGDEQSIEQTLSTFSWHVTNLVHIFRHATGNSLVLLDELGTSTDPTEGSALARAILRYFLNKGTLAVATTHFSDLKAFAHTTQGMQNASLEFDPKTLAPTYHLTLGLPGGSNALATAARLGIPAEIIEDAKSMLAGGSHEMENLLANLMEEKQKVGVLQRDLELERVKMVKRNADLEKEKQRLKNEERRTVQAARDEIIREAAELHKEIKQAVSDLRKEKTQTGIEHARKSLTRIREQMESEKWQASADIPEEESAIIKAGDTVMVKDTGLTATVLAVSEAEQEIEVQAGRMKMRLALSNVAKITPSGKALPAPVKTPPAHRVSLELDLRGKRADAVEPLLDAYLNDAAQANISEARIIHGHATGTVRSIVREYLKHHPLAKSFRPGIPGEGGDGVTMVKL